MTDEQNKQLATKTPTFDEWVQSSAVSEISISRDAGVAIQNYGDCLRLANAFTKAQMLPSSYGKIGRDFDPQLAMQQASIAIMTGIPLGLNPLQALNGLAIINNRPTIWGDTALALVRRHPECVSVREWLDGEARKSTWTAHCVIVRKRKDGEPQEIHQTFTWAQATVAKLTGKTGPWQDYPERMMQMRARSWAMRDAFPDALGGLDMTEEARDIEPAFDPSKMAQKPQTRMDALEGALGGDEPAEEPVATMTSGTMIGDDIDSEAITDEVEAQVREGLYESN
ncbi:MAG: hypothetical protein ACIAQU_04200 [Phycisphaerales bacterium JB064]